MWFKPADVHSTAAGVTETDSALRVGRSDWALITDEYCRIRSRILAMAETAPSRTKARSIVGTSVAKKKLAPPAIEDDENSDNRSMPVGEEYRE